MEGKELTMGSLFSGSGGFELASLIAGIRPVWASEVEPYPIRVTTRRMPWLRHLGDIHDIRGGEVEPVDIITGGSPCQDVSIAGKRTGLEGARSGLFFEMIRVIREMREKTDGRYPRYIIWENVPGAFSSSGGEDFRTVIEEFCRIRYPEVSVPKAEKWHGAGLILEDGFSLSRGEFSMPSTGESPREGGASTLSSILMEGVPERYFLSPRACRGILRRAAERGKKLPELLETALMEQAASA